MFLANIITGSGVMTIFIHKEFTQKSRNRKYLCLSFFQYQQTGANEGYQFSMNVSNEKLLNAAKCHIYNYFVSR